VLAEAQSHSELFIAQLRMVGREVSGKIAFVVAGSPADSTF
jgi:hypothetical protein